MSMNVKSSDVDVTSPILCDVGLTTAISCNVGLTTAIPCNVGLTPVMWDLNEFVLGFCYDCLSMTVLRNFTEKSVEKRGTSFFIFLLTVD